jgi:hypothetical protein
LLEAVVFLAKAPPPSAVLFAPVVFDWPTAKPPVHSRPPTKVL